MRAISRYFCLFCLFVAPAAHAQSVAGAWTGTIDVPGSPLGIEVVLTQADGGWRGSISIPVQNLRDYALAGVRVTPDSAFFQMDGIPGTPRFAGRIGETGTEIRGDFFQGGGRLTFLLTRADAAAEQAAATAREALAGFDSLVTATMAEWKVPGAALALVQGDSVIYLRGFGVRDVAANAPVTPETRFAIGSATKAFTAMGLALLEDEGLLAWDDPVASYLPAFRLHDPVATQQMTAVDLLTHRSGLPRHDLLWYATPFSRDELFQRLRHLEPTKPFRGAWQYQNLMYMVAGYLTGHLAGTTWEDFLQQRLLDPLGMRGASLRMADMLATDDHATGYGGGRDSIDALPPFTLDAIGPAGSINASARDMAQWVKLQLSDGEVGGRRIVSEGNLRFLHTPQVFVAPNGQQESPYLLYTPGWFAEVYRGRRLLHHGGNIDGFSALVGFMPDDDIGFVILTNKNGTPIPRGLMLSAFDRLLDFDATDWLAQIRPAASDSLDAVGPPEDDEAQRISGTTPSHELSAFAGTFTHPAYGTITIQQQGDALRAQYYTLDLPLAHWHYDTFEATETLVKGTKITFYTDVDGLVSRLALPIEPMLNPVVFERQAAEVSADELARYAGRYRLGSVTITVAVQGSRLTMTVPGQPVYTLEPTAQADTFAPKELSGYRVRFEAEAGKVTQIVLIQPNGTFRAERVE